MAPANAEVYVNDERKGSVGSSGRVVLTDIPAGQHILRVSKAGERDDERVIEIREGGQEQVIQAQLRIAARAGKPAVAVAGKQHRRLSPLERDAGHRRVLRIAVRGLPRA